jgi:hypothetical protein
MDISIDKSWQDKWFANHILHSFGTYGRFTIAWQGHKWSDTADTAGIWILDTGEKIGSKAVAVGFGSCAVNYGHDDDINLNKIS